MVLFLLGVAFMITVAIFLMALFIAPIIAGLTAPKNDEEIEGMDDVKPLSEMSGREIIERIKHNLGRN
ncbi:MAG: hypothetical protein ABEJ83_04085 [Candidatus Nanohaloarchaea archaeon]